MFIEFNPNPVGRKVGDCSVRAVAKALDIDWEMAYAKLVKNGFLMADMPSSDSVWGAVLRGNGFVRRTFPEDCPFCYTAGEFAKDHPNGVYVLAFGGHVATVQNGNLYDSWDSSDEIPLYYYEKKENE